MKLDTLGLDVGIAENLGMGGLFALIYADAYAIYVRPSRRHNSYLSYVLSRVGAAPTSSPKEVGLMFAVAGSMSCSFSDGNW